MLCLREPFCLLFVYVPSSKTLFHFHSCGQDLGLTVLALHQMYCLCIQNENNQTSRMKKNTIKWCYKVKKG